MMAYESIDRLQNVLSEKVFHYAKDKKKAAGRALGTLVEIINFYLLKTWGFNSSISIERGLIEYGNNNIKHNVEYSLHPVIEKYNIQIPNNNGSLTANRILKHLKDKIVHDKFSPKHNALLDRENTLRNACTIGSSAETFLLASVDSILPKETTLFIFEQIKKPYAIFECKRVGVEEGMKKGPQTIEKAKQGAYVAKAVSSLQKIRNNNGELYGIIYDTQNKPHIKPYTEFMEEIIYSDETKFLKKFVLTIGIVSNHGNWFTTENQNKELRVLAQSYDWLVFLTDNGLAQFVDDLLLNPAPEYDKIQKAFSESYKVDKKRNIFTKVKMNFDADAALMKYFSEKTDDIEKWFNIIAPANKTIHDLKKELKALQSKKWNEIL